MYRSKKSKTSLQYRLETSRTLHAPAEGTISLEECRGTDSPERRARQSCSTSRKPTETEHTKQNRKEQNIHQQGEETPLNECRGTFSRTQARAALMKAKTKSKKQKT
jgi:hypothetical protein